MKDLVLSQDVVATKNRLDVRGQLALSGQLICTFAGTREDDFAPAGIDHTSGIDAKVSADTSLTGIYAGATPVPGRVFYVVNRQTSTADLRIVARNTNSSVANWFAIAHDILLHPGEGALFAYYPPDSPDNPGWRCVGAYFDTADLVVDGGVVVSDGDINRATALAVDRIAQNKVLTDIQLTGWELVGSVGAGAQLQLFKASHNSYDGSTFSDLTGTSTGTGGMPELTGTIRAQSTDLSLWTSTTLSAGDIVRGVLIDNTGAHKWYSCRLYGRRTLTRY